MYGRVRVEGAGQQVNKLLTFNYCCRSHRPVFILRGKHSSFVHNLHGANFSPYRKSKMVLKATVYFTYKQQFFQNIELLW